MSSEEGLSAGWTLVPLADLLIAVEAGKSFKCEERPPDVDEVGVVKVSAVTWGEYQEQESKTCTDSERINETLFVKPGDFLFSRANTIELVGACVIVRQVSRRVMLSDKILRFTFVGENMKPWVLNLLRSSQGRLQIESLASGNQESMRNIGQGRIGQILVPLPPSAEQNRIVEKLDELLSDLDAGVAELRTAKRKLATYRQSLLKAALEGALTTDWRAARATNGDRQEPAAELVQRILAKRRKLWEQKQLAKFAEQGKAPPRGWQDKYPQPISPDLKDLPELPNGWEWASLDMLGEIASGVAKGTKRSSDVATREVHYLRVANVQRGFLNLAHVKTIEATEKDIAELRLRSGDVLFNEGGDLDKLGRGWVWRGEVVECIHQNHVFRMRPALPATPSELISHHGNTFGKQWFKTAGKQTTNLASINLTLLRSFPVPVAPEVEAHEIVSRLEPLLTVADEQERAISRSIAQATAQRKNILKAAFAGQLVPQDPNDEPASKLLERIRAKRANFSNGNAMLSRIRKTT